MLDFLEYCRTLGYVEPPFPEGYWPKTDAPASEAEWQPSTRKFSECMKQLEELILNPSTDLMAIIPGSSGRTALRQTLACLNHNAYHLGQVILLRRLLGIWT